jgi:hypothetical protein
LTNLNNKSKIEVLIPNSELKCEESYGDFLLTLFSLIPFTIFMT